MKKILKSPTANAVCISLFTTFYASIFLICLGNTEIERLFYYDGGSSFWSAWSNFLVSNNHAYVAWFLVVVTIIVVILLLKRRYPYDEYHVLILTYCLIIATVLKLSAVAIFYLMILNDPIWILGKFTLFIIIHWSTVVFANLAYILLCHRR
jgi:hypothetical protein